MKRNGFADNNVHERKDSIIKQIKSIEINITYVFSDGDCLNQQFQKKNYGIVVAKIK